MCILNGILQTVRNDDHVDDDDDDDCKVVNIIVTDCFY